MAAKSFQVAIVENYATFWLDVSVWNFRLVCIRDHGWVELIFATYVAFH